MIIELHRYQVTCDRCKREDTSWGINQMVALTHIGFTVFVNDVGVREHVCKPCTRKDDESI